MVVREILEKDFSYSYKKSLCKYCINKKVNCEYCDKEFDSTNLSKHIKQIHSTYNSSRTNDFTYNSSYNTSGKNYSTRTNDSTSNKTNKINSTSNKTNKINSTSNKTNKNNSASNKTNKNNSTSEITLSDQLYVSSYTDSLKSNNIFYDKKDIDKINKIPARNRILNDKTAKD